VDDGDTVLVVVVVVAGTSAATSNGVSNLDSENGSLRDASTGGDRLSFAFTGEEF
jgi:hypothetical protein